MWPLDIYEVDVCERDYSHYMTMRLMIQQLLYSMSITHTVYYIQYTVYPHQTPNTFTILKSTYY